jgi:hypothetical protein
VIKKAFSYFYRTVVIMNKEEFGKGLKEIEVEMENSCGADWHENYAIAQYGLVPDAELEEYDLDE